MSTLRYVHGTQKVGSVRTKKAALNFVMSFLRNFVSLLIGIISTPIILSYLGEERFGIWRVLVDWIGHLSLAEFGLFGALLTLFVKSIAGKSVPLNAVFRLGFQQYSIVFLLQVIALGLFCLVFERFIPVSDAAQHETWVCYFIVAVTPFFTHSQVFRAYLEASQRGYIVSYVMILQNIIFVGATLLFLHWGYGLKGQAVALVVSIAFAMIVYTIFCLPEIKSYFLSQDKFVDTESFSIQRKSQFWIEVGGRAAFLSDNLIITFVLGTREVTGFFLTQRLIQIAQAQLQNVGNSAWAGMGELYYQNNFETFKARLFQITEVTAFLSGIGLATLIYLNPSFVVLWTGKVSFAGLSISNLAAINAGFFALASLWSWCFSSTHKSEKILMAALVQSVVNVILSVTLTYKIGLAGPLWGTLVSTVMMMAWLGMLLKKYFDVSISNLHRSWVVPMVPPISIALVLVYWGWIPEIQTWTTLVLWVIGVGLIVSPICYFTLLRKTSREFFRHQVTKLFGR